MTRRRAAEAGAVAWAVVGAAVALPALPEVNDDAAAVVGVASVVLPLCALGAAGLLRRGQFRVAGLLLVASAATPTYFTYALNVPALLVGFLLVVAPAFLRSEPPRC